MMEFVYKKGGPMPSGKAMIFAEFAEEEKIAYLALEVVNKVIPAGEMMQGLEAALKQEIPAKVMAFGIEVKLTPEQFENDSFIAQYDGDVISVGKVNSPLVAMPLVLGAAKLYSEQYALQAASKFKKLEKEEVPLPAPKIAYKEMKTGDELTGYLGEKVAAYDTLRQDEKKAGDVAMELREFSDGTPISPQVEFLLRLELCDHPKKEVLMPIIINECAAIFREDFEEASRLRDQIKEQVSV